MPAGKQSPQVAGRSVKPCGMKVDQASDPREAAIGWAHWLGKQQMVCSQITNDFDQLFLLRLPGSGPVQGTDSLAREPIGCHGQA